MKWALSYTGYQFYYMCIFHWQHIVVSTVYINDLLDTENAGLARLTYKLVANKSNQAMFTFYKDNLSRTNVYPSN